MLPAPTNGSVTYSTGDTTYLTVATFSCHVGYTLSMVVQRICQADKQWSSTSPDCIINGKDIVKPVLSGHLKIDKAKVLMEMVA